MKELLQQPVHFILACVVMPVWLLVGVADWLCHRRTDIAHTSGVKESALHLVMVAEGGLAVLAVIFLRINAAVLLLVSVLLLAHALTTHWDLHYASKTREVGPFEQSVHAWMEALPLAAFALLVASHWPQFLAIFGAGSAAADWRLAWKDQPLPALEAFILLAASIAFGTLPYIEELQRSWKAGRKRHPQQPRR